MPTFKKQKNIPDKLKSIVIPTVKVQTAPPPTETSFISKVLKKVRNALGIFNGKPDTTLQGRIHELDSHASEFYNELIKIKSEFNPKTDAETYTFVEAIIDPLIKELPLLEQGIHSKNIAQQAKAFKRYNIWVERAKIWVQFYRQNHEKKDLIDAVVHHLVGEALVLIDKDVQVIKEYEHHQIKGLTLMPDEQDLLQQKLQQNIEPYIQQLQGLKKRPATITLDDLGAWKNQIDGNRQAYFENALRAVDEMVEQLAPSRFNDEAHEHLQEVISETLYIEREVDELLYEVRYGDVDSIQQKMLQSHLAALAEEVHELSLDQRINWETTEKIQSLAANIAKAQHLLHERFPSD